MTSFFPRVSVTDLLHDAFVEGGIIAPFKPMGEEQAVPCLYLALATACGDDNSSAAPREFYLPLLCPKCGRPLHFADENLMAQFAEKLSCYVIVKDDLVVTDDAQITDLIRRTPFNLAPPDFWHDHQSQAPYAVHYLYLERSAAVDMDEVGEADICCGGESYGCGADCQADGATESTVLLIHPMSLVYGCFELGERPAAEFRVSDDQDRCDDDDEYVAPWQMPRVQSADSHWGNIWATVSIKGLK